MENGVDLHTHSTASDGTCTPKELVRKAKEIGLYALALTDHDTISGVKEAQEEAQKIGLRFLPGVEISVRFEGPGHCHLLGYFLRYQHPRLEKALFSLQEARSNRNQKMVKKLQELGIEISLDELKALARGGEIGRPHMAKLLVQKGVVRDFEEAFKRYLGKGCPAYVPKALFSAQEAIEMVHEVGGVVSLAHPYYLKLSREETEEFVRSLKDQGLDAVEAYYTDHDASYTAFCLELAQKFALLVTGGSDFHGANKPDIRLGQGKGHLHVPPQVYEELRERIS